MTNTKNKMIELVSNCKGFREIHKLDGAIEFQLGSYEMKKFLRLRDGKLSKKNFLAFKRLVLNLVKKSN